MQRKRWRNGLVWLVMMLSVSGAIVFEGGAGFASRTITTAPGHEPSECGTCRAHERSRGPQLPYELGGDNVRFVYPGERGDGRELMICENDEE